MVRLAIFYALLCFALWAGQYRLLYIPDRMDSGRAVAMAERGGLAPWPSATDIRGRVAEPDAPAKGTVAVFHGNAGDALGRDFLVPLFRAEGWRVVLLEYQGYCPRPGDLGEGPMVADLVTSMQRLEEELGDQRLIVLGESMGAGMAAATLARWTERQPDAVVLITPWDTLRDLAAARFFFVPARWIVTDRFDSIANLKGVKAPVLVIVAAEDEVIPQRHSRRLFDSLQQRKEWIEIPNAGHNTWPGSFGRAEVGRILELATQP